MIELLPKRMSDKIFIGVGCGCWEWAGAKQSNGYGRLWNGEKSDYSHRVVFTQIKGNIPSGLDLDHLCRNRRCVNPDHLEPVTRSTNLRRGNAGENIAIPLRNKTHCPRGHEYSGHNLTVRNGRRHCKACARERYHERKNHA